MEEFELIAKTFQGLEEVLAKELTALGANNIQMGRRMVSFTGNKEMMYRANFSLRTALRILKPIKHFRATNADDVYEAVKAVEWGNIMNENNSFSVDSVVFSNEFRHSQYVAYRVKDAIVDYFREKGGNRPNVKLSNPDFYISIHIADETCTLSLDSSGESLHRRGYRQEALEAPLNEVLAAGMLLMTGWQGECDLIDPMSGSGTIPIEAALIARNIAPGVFRKGYAFEKWVDFDRDLFEEIYNDDSQEREFEHHIYGYDIKQQANVIAQRNVKAAGLSKDITLEVRDFAEFTLPQEKSIIVTNPPYGERISVDDLLGLYEMIGSKLKHEFKGNEAWVLSYREECFAKIGLKPSVRIPLYNGALECEFRKYEMFEGRFKSFRAQGEELDKTERPMFSKPLRGKTFRTERHTEPKPDQAEPVSLLDSLSEFDPADELEVRHRKLVGMRKAAERERIEYGKARRAQLQEEQRAEEEKKRREGRRGDSAFHKDGDRKPFRKDGERKPFRKDGERKPFGKDGGKLKDRKPFRKDKPGEGRQQRREDRKKMFGKKNNER
ncbi:MAG: RNA methyltransferase [Bacteroidaceae bacterium]|nr:RNA methyltransferase [Bacteroidaceae bacterium]